MTRRTVNSEMLSVTLKKIEKSILFDFEQMTLLWQGRKMWSLGVQAAVEFIAMTLPLIPLSSGSNSQDGQEYRLQRPKSLTL